MRRHQALRKPEPYPNNCTKEAATALTPIDKLRMLTDASTKISILKSTKGTKGNHESKRKQVTYGNNCGISGA